MRHASHVSNEVMTAAAAAAQTPSSHARSAAWAAFYAAAPLSFVLAAAPCAGAGFGAEDSPSRTLGVSPTLRDTLRSVLDTSRY